MSLTEFSEQIDWIAKAFTVVPIGELLSRLKTGRSIAGLSVLTFDDGYAGCLEHAVPVMRALSVPFALFPVVQAADQHKPYWWDALGSIDDAQREQHLTVRQGDRSMIIRDGAPSADMPDAFLPGSWDLLRSLRADDCTFGVHGITHRNLNALPSKEVAWELNHSRDRLAAELGAVPDVVAYPYGRGDRRVQDEASRAGFEGGLGLDFGLVRPGASPFALQRINIPVRLSLPTFACWASGLQLRR